MKKLTLIFLFLSTISFSQKASLEKDTILIGDQIKFTINHVLGCDYQIEWPIYSNSIVDGIEIIKKSDIDTLYDHDPEFPIIQQQYIITSFDSGTYTIPPIFFSEDVKSEEVTLVVNTIAVNDSTKMSDQSPPLIGEDEDLTVEELDKLNEKKRNKTMIIIVIVLLLIAIAYLVYKYLQRKEIIKPKVIVPIHVTALNKLQNLKKQKLWQKGELKEYYSKISTIIREYTELRFGFNALELPTSDILSELKKLKVEKEIIESLGLLLRRADNIKYAKGLSLEDENKEVMELSVNFIKKTKIENERISK